MCLPKKHSFFLLIGVTNVCKAPLAYFLTGGPLKGESINELLKESIHRLHDVGVRVRSITCDGAAANLAALRLLGASLPDQPWFQHPQMASTARVFVNIDAVHMIKLARNAFASGDMKNTAGERVSWTYISTMFRLQEEEGLRFATKITAAHVTEWRKRKMRVKLATQVLSRSVADALQLLSDIKHKDFVDVAATIDHIRLLDG